MNPLRRLLLGSGRLPEDLRESLSAEGMVLLVEGVPGSVTAKNLRTPGQYANWRRDAVVAAIAVSTKRFVVRTRGLKHIDVPLTKLARYKVTAAERRPGQLAVTYDLATSHPDWTGEVELRLRTDQAARIARIIAQTRQD